MHGCRPWPSAYAHFDNRWTLREIVNQRFLHNSLTAP